MYFNWLQGFAAAFDDVFTEVAVDAVVIGFNDYLANENGEKTDDRNNLLTMVRTYAYDVFELTVST